MTWLDKWSRQPAGWYDHLLAQDLIRPEDIMPEVEVFRFYIDAFQDLSTCRSIGMGLGPIPFTALVEYSRVFEVGDFEIFHYLMGLMDRTFLKNESARMNSKKSEGEEKTDGSIDPSKKNSNKN